MAAAWSYEGPAPGGDADGSICVFCGQKLVEEHQPARYTRKAEEDDQDVDYPTEYGYAHRACHDAQIASQRKGRFALPEVPK